MTLRASLLAVAACGLLWAGAGAGAAAAQELQAGQMMTQAEADRLEALQTDLDREEAEDADADLRTREERLRRRRERDRRDAAETETEQEAWKDEDYVAYSACVAKLGGHQATMVEQILTQYRLTVQSLEDSAGPGADLGGALAGQRALRDQLIRAIVGETCS